MTLTSVQGGYAQNRNLGDWRAFFWSCGDEGARYSFEGFDQFAFNEEVAQTYDNLLERYVEPESGWVRYQAWLKHEADLMKLDEVLDAIARQDVDPAVNRSDELKAFFINAYNALTIRLILDNYDGTLKDGRRSILNIQNLGADVWNRFRFRAGGKYSINGRDFGPEKSLNEIEKEILLKIDGGDARLHFALNCASIGCPSLYRKAFRADTLDETLDHLADQFVNGKNPHATRFRNRTIETSELLKWYQADFERSFGSLKGFFQKYFRGIHSIQDYRIEFQRYDWGLNEFID